MSVEIKNAPAEVFDTFKKEIQTFRFGEVVSIDEENQQPYIPHQIYDPSTVSLATGDDLSNAGQPRWRYVFQDAYGAYHVAEMGIDEQTGKPKLILVNAGGHVNNFVASYNHMQTGSDGKPYEMNVLRVPACYVMASWLKGIDHDDEIFIPLAPVNEKFEAGKLYGRDEFTQLLKEAAQEVIRPTSQPSNDDIIIIEGIGPKVAEIFKRNGISTFADIANSTAEALKNILVAESTSYNRFDTTTWPQQAQLAVEGKWEELAKLKAKLRAGRPD